MKLKEGINGYLEGSTTPKFRRAIALRNAWERIAPASVLPHTDNIVESKRKENSVVVFVDTPHEAANLSMSKEYYRQMMEHETGFPISDIFFSVSKRASVSSEFKKKEEERPWYIDDCELAPLDAGELAYIEQSVAAIEDEELKELVFKAFVSNMEWKKGLRESKKAQNLNEGV